MYKNIHLKILAPFLENPYTKFHIRELARMLKLNPMTIRKYLEKMSRENILKTEKDKGKVKNYWANMENVLFKEYKKFYSITKIIDSGLLDFLNEEFLYPTIILFGSAAKGEDFEKSDLDVFILSNTKKEVDLERFEKKVNRKIQLFVMTSKEFKKSKRENPQLINNIINGIKLAGFIEVT